MNKKLLFLVFLSLWPTGLMAQSQQAATPESKLIQFQMAILKKGPQWDGTKEADRNSILKEHFGSAVALLERQA